MSLSVEISMLARLLETGLVRGSSRNIALVKRFETARWVDPSGRKNEWKVKDIAITALTSRLTELFPSWREDFVFLRSISRDPFDPKDIEAIPSFRRNLTSVGMINRRNWNAARGLGPKHRARIPSNNTLTKDWVMRFRPNTGLLGNIGGNQVDFHEQSKLLFECFIPERSWINFQRFFGTLPNFIVTCENLGAYIDLPTSEEIMVIFSPGADTEPAIKLLNALPNSHWLHFGDLDHEGIKIAQQISTKTGRKLKLFIPSFAREYLKSASNAKSEWGNVPDHDLLLALKHSKKRIFQEVFMLDERLSTELQNIAV